MPIFEYRCAECDSKFEELVFGRGEDSTTCKICGSPRVSRLFSTFAAQSNSSSNGGACYNQTAGICQAGGGAAP